MMSFIGQFFDRFLSTKLSTRLTFFFAEYSQTLWWLKKLQVKWDLLQDFAEYGTSGNLPRCLPKVRDEAYLPRLDGRGKAVTK